MKVVIFCGGLGMRLRDFSENIPKPMAPIGHRPILWHVMKYYAHYGFKDFVLCLGYRSEAIKDYFLNYNECVSNDFVLTGGGKNVELISRDIDDWKITFAETGVNSNIGQRLKAVEKYLSDETEFMANYSDGLTDLDLHQHLADFRRSGKTATFMSARPNLSYHVVSAGPDGAVQEIKEITQSGLRINAGYFIFKREIFNHIRPGEELVQEPFQRLIRERQLTTNQHNGFYACLDTFKDKQQLDDLLLKGTAPWEVWKTAPNGTHSGAALSKSNGATAAPIPAVADRHA